MNQYSLNSDFIKKYAQTGKTEYGKIFLNFTSGNNITFK